MMIAAPAPPLPSGLSLPHGLPSLPSSGHLTPITPRSRPKWPSRPASGLFVDTPIARRLLRVVLGHPRQAIPAVTLTGCLAAIPRGSMAVRFTPANGAPPQQVQLDRTGFSDAWIDIFEGDNGNLDFTTELLDCSKVSSPVIAQGVFTAPDTRIPGSEPLPNVMRESLLDAEKRIVGSLVCETKLITPLAMASTTQSQKTPENIPVSHKTPKLAGHRGCGGHTATDVPENTLQSFLTVTKGNRVTHVELDVQLSADGTPVIYHDFLFPGRDMGDRTRSLFELTTDSFKSKNGHIPADDLPTSSLPTLAEVCSNLPVDVGLLLEVKYPTPEDFTRFGVPFPDRNLLIDNTLNVIFGELENARRDIALLCFDPEICSMIRLKQNQLPVYFLNSEDREELNDLLDPRTVTVDGALNFAKSRGMSGLVLLADIPLEDSSICSRIRDAGLHLMTYGRKNSLVECIRRQFENGVNGLIADRADLLAGFV